LGHDFKVNEDMKIIIAKLCDFGVAKEVSNTNKNTMDIVVGTTRWLAPEVIQGKGKHFDEKADIWSFGMVLLEMVTLQVPYHDTNLFDVKQKILSQNLPFIEESTRSNFGPIVDIILKCLKYNSSERPNTDLFNGIALFFIFFYKLFFDGSYSSFHWSQFFFFYQIKFFYKDIKMFEICV